MKFPAAFILPVALGAIFSASGFAQSPFAGRWDITLTSATETWPDWMEYSVTAGAARARVQARTGSVRPAEITRSEASHLELLITKGTTWSLDVTGNTLTGIQKTASAETKITGVRAPMLNRANPVAWSTPEPLFNSKDLKGWDPMGTAVNHWVAKDGVLLNEASGANLRTTRTFDDFKLHFEYNCPVEGNSGIYLRGRYEIQIEYAAADVNDKLHGMASVYGMIPAALDLPRAPGTWESMDITLVGRRVTVARNGKTVIDNQEIPGLTGGAIDASEAAPGPFYIQGDHTGGMMFRNITVALPRQ